MSEELNKASNELSDVLNSFNYERSILKIRREPETNHFNEILALEGTYHDLSKLLLKKLNKLLFLSDLKGLVKEPDSTINKKYDDFANTLTNELVPSTFDENEERGKLEILRHKLKLQILSFKTETLLGVFILCTLPILRAVHELKTGITETEAKVSHNLTKLYNVHEKNLKCNIYNLMQLMSENHEQRHKSHQLHRDIAKFLNGSVGDQIRTLNKLEVKTELTHREYLQGKDAQISAIIKSRSLKVKEKYEQLANEWARISIYCAFLHMFISSFPIDWYSNEVLSNIVNETDRVSRIMSRYELTVNIRNIEEWSPTELCMVDFQELKVFADI